MKMLARKRALDKIYKRRDRYEIPDWQRDKVWDDSKKQELIDSILRGWKLPKFYFLKVADEPEEFEVVDGQQRLTAIFEFFDGELELSDESSQRFGARRYEELPSTLSDAFDDFEIEYDEITDADEGEIKAFFQRLQQGLPLTGSEKLNAVHSKLTDFCREMAKHSLLQNKVAFGDKRYAYFDVVAKVAAVEIEGIDTGLRFDDLRLIFDSQANFSAESAAAQRLQATLDYLDRAFSAKSPYLRNRTVVQSVATLAARIVGTRRAGGTEKTFAEFVAGFMTELSTQVELGQNATDPDYLLFQRSVNANVRSGPRTRHEILLRKLFRSSPSLAELFDPSIIAESGLAAEIRRLGESVSALVGQANSAYAAKHGGDLFKATTKTASALTKLGKTIGDYAGYSALVTDLYFLFREAAGGRIGASDVPGSFSDVNALRTDLQHDLDHGKPRDAAAKRKKVSAAFSRYAGDGTSPATIAPERFSVFQANLLAALEADLRKLISGI